MPDLSSWWWGSKHHWNVGKLLSDYTAKKFKGHLSSYSPEPEILISTLAVNRNVLKTNTNEYVVEISIINYLHWNTKFVQCYLSFLVGRIRLPKNSRMSWSTGSQSFGTVRSETKPALHAMSRPAAVRCDVTTGSLNGAGLGKKLKPETLIHYKFLR
jgi:hypothetical protein